MPEMPALVSTHGVDGMLTVHQPMGWQKPMKTIRAPHIRVP